ncbi:hypothetical protein Tco_1277575 [Tanacetum coccineum]
MREGRLRWFGHVKRRPQSAPVRRVESITIDGVRRRGGSKLRTQDLEERIIKTKGSKNDKKTDKKWKRQDKSEE